MAAEGLSRVTLDFDGSVQSTGRHAEGTAVGFNKQKKGARSYYPLFCTVAQTAQVLDLEADLAQVEALAERAVELTQALRARLVAVKAFDATGKGS